MKLIDSPSVIEACGTKPKVIQKFIGMINSGTSDVSIAKMKNPQSWEEPGQAIIAGKGEWVQYSTPYEGGAEYISVCLPAFTPRSVHRDNT